MDIKELMKEATPLPWRAGLQEPRIGARKVNEKLFNHCVNNFMPLLEALEAIVEQRGGKWSNTPSRAEQWSKATRAAMAAIAAAKEAK